MFNQHILTSLLTDGALHKCASIDGIWQKI